MDIAGLDLIGTRMSDVVASSPNANDRLQAIMAACVRLDGSDVHLAPNLPPYWRVHGVLAPRDEFGVMSAEEVGQVAAILVSEFSSRQLEELGDCDGAISSADGTRFRFNVFRRQDQTSIALRRLEERFQTLAELGLPDNLYELSNYADGLIVVAGPTGAGKSTTLATLINRINENRQCHIVTIEDPIEYLHSPIKSLVNQRQVGSDTRSFNDALVASLRQDPDVILVGEIRDLNTIRTAITAAETGHLVLTTVHAGDCVGAIERLVSVFPANEQDGIRRQLSLVLRAVVAQHLLVADGPAGDAEKPASAASGQVLRRQRVVASEILRMSSAVSNLIATAKSSQIYSSMETGASQGMQTLEQDLARLWVTNQISESAAMAIARNPNVVRDRAVQAKANIGRLMARSGGGKH